MIRVFLKILLLPVFIILLMVRGMVKIIVKGSYAVGGWLLIYVGACAGYCLFCQRWSDVFILMIIGACILITTSSLILIEIIIGKFLDII